MPPEKIMVNSSRPAKKPRPGISHWMSTYAPSVDRSRPISVPASVVITLTISGRASVGLENTET